MSAIYFFGTSTFSIRESIYGRIVSDIMREFMNEPDNKTGTLISLFAAVIVQITFIIYAYLSLTLVDFKQYLQDITGGYGLIDRYTECSIFLCQRKQSARTQASLIDAEDSTSSQVNALLGQNRDSQCVWDCCSVLSEADDEYKQNYEEIAQKELAYRSSV
ncbi:unnamed protein product [Moneuplotes crassus]|uniref:Uncharacterized protein n=1 Tax=Euplotes crassus TaxID=5936 RepID=A0AAD1UQR4_EUPCR|nr:unnamed protein product [Moneuplotes crassus]